MNDVNERVISRKDSERGLKGVNYGYENKEMDQ